MRLYRKRVETHEGHVQNSDAQPQFPKSRCFLAYIQLNTVSRGETSHFWESEINPIFPAFTTTSVPQFLLYFASHCVQEKFKEKRV